MSTTLRVSPCQVLWLLALSLLLMIGCTKTKTPLPPVESPRLAALEARVEALSKELELYKVQVGNTVKESQEKVLDVEAKRLARDVMKTKVAPGFTDCWASWQNGRQYRNCTDSQGNTSRRNF